MPNPLFSALGGNPMGNIMQMLGQFKQNPLALLQRAGFSVPANVSNPQQIIQHLTQTGQINQNQLNHAQQMAQMFGGLK